MIWVVFALLTGAAVLSLLWPLSRRAAGQSQKESDLAFYRAQVREIDLDVARGLTSPIDAEAARALAGRRLLSAAQVEPGVRPGTLFARRAAAIATLAIVPTVALGLYAVVGSPDFPDQPLSARIDAPASKMDLGIAVARIEQHLQADPSDGRGWDVIAPVYMRLGRFSDAAQAYGKAIQFLGETEARRRAIGEALMANDGGNIGDGARAAFARAAQLDPKDPAPHFYLGLAAEQVGDIARARQIWTDLLGQASPGAAWAPTVRSQLAALSSGGAVADGSEPGPSSAPGEAASIAAMPADRQAAMISGMVGQLADRLSKQGGGVDDWSRLVRAYVVLHDEQKARAALTDARRNLANDEGALGRLSSLARQLGLES